MRIKQLVQRLFSCQFHEPLCKNSWGCRCGKRKVGKKRGIFGALTGAALGSFLGPAGLIGGAILGGGTGASSAKIGRGRGRESKAEQRADDLTRQTEAQATAATALDPQEAARRQLAFDLLNQQVPFLQSRARATPEDLLRQVGPTATSYDDLIRARLGMTGDQLVGGISPTALALQSIVQSRLGQTGEQLFESISPTAGDLQRTIQNRLTSFPQISFEDTLRPELDLLRQQVSSFANQRGIVGSGLELEQLGRTGSELAIRQARLRQENAFANQQLQQQAIANAQRLVSDQESLSSRARFEAMGLSDTQQSLLDQSRAEAAGVTQASASLSNQARAELARQLQDIEAFSQADRSRAVQGQITGQELAQPFQMAGLESLNQREQARKQRNAMIASALGSAALGGLTGGLGFLPGLAGSGGAAAGGGFSLGGFGRGVLQSLTGTGDFSPFAGLSSLLSQQRQRPFRGAGAGNYPWLSQVYGDVG